MDRTSTLKVLEGGGDMGARMRALDWSLTAVGPVEGWPQSLRTAVSLLLNSRFPMMIHWGPELTQFYNDAYVPSLGSKHPGALGQAARIWWPEIWDVLGPMFERVLAGEATWYTDQLFLPNRRGFVEEAYFTLSHSPLRDESGSINGIFLAVTETTGQVLGERRLRALKALGEASANPPGPREACLRVARVLEDYRHDVPFAVLYLGSAGAGALRRAALVGLPETSPAAPEWMPWATGPEGAWPWPVVQVAATGVPLTLEDLETRASGLPGGPWPEAPHQALVLPVGMAGAPTGAAGALVVGISPRRPLDADYRSFLSLVAGQVTAALERAFAADEARRRVEASAALDRAKTAFFSDVSHELRTPLTLLVGPLDEALADLARPLSGLQRERVEMASRGAQRLLKLVGAVLDFSRMDAERMQARLEPTDLSGLTAATASVFEHAFQAAGVRLVIDCPPLTAAVRVDREAWEKIVLNLVSNAFKFTLAGEVRVLLREREDRVELEVRDTGTGIPEAELPRVFERFYRVRGTRGRSVEGSGIGLSLVWELARMHGGEVRVESDWGQGSSFVVSLPARLVPDAVASRPVPHAQAFVREAEGWLASSASPEARPAGRLGHVLLAEDNADMRTHLRLLLEGAGYTVDAVAEGRTALERVRARMPDLVLSDVMMPGQDGFELLRALKSEESTAHLPLLLVSARAGEEAIVEALAAGASDYLVKPFSSRELLARVEGALKMEQARADLDAFAGRVAHDLRNLLFPLSMIGERMRGSTDERARQSGAHLARIARRAFDMLDGMLAFSQPGTAVVPQAPVSLQAVLEAVEEDLATLRTRVGASLDVRGVEDAGVVLPRGLLYVVLINLLTNAFKFMVDRPEKQVVVKSHAEPGWCVLSVQDTGPGMSTEVLSRIFDPFYRAPGAVVSGHGIGLATVKRILAVHGGRVGVESTPGQGTCFTVWLPRATTG